MAEPNKLLTGIRLQLDFGVDEVIGENPINRYVSQTPNAGLLTKTRKESESLANGDNRLEAKPKTVFNSKSDHGPRETDKITVPATSLEELYNKLAAFEGCTLKRTATNLVFSDGTPEAEVMIIGEAPGAEEDRLGTPFVGASGKLLDRIVSSIGLNRNSIYITNVIPWRPPGNRKPTPAEISACLPFTIRHIELVKPKILVLAGAAASTALLNSSRPISQIRGRWQTYSSPGISSPIAAIPTFHPAFLLRTPGQKRLVWRDFISIKIKLSEFAKQN